MLSCAEAVLYGGGVHSPIAMDKDRHMSKALKVQRASLEAELKKLDGRMKELQKREREAAMDAVERSGLLKLDSDRLGDLLGRMKALGFDEVERRLADSGKPHVVPAEDGSGRQTATSGPAPGLSDQRQGMAA